jgi:hypothetical protein
MAGITPGATDTNSTQYLIASQAAAQIPVVGGIVADIVGIFNSAHAQAVKVEAQTLSAAVPQWRSLLASTVAAYNAGQISVSQAISYIEEAKGIYYTQVKPIQKGSVPAGGIGITGYMQDQFPRFAPFSPCNAACNIAYYHIEPEAQIVEAAINSGTAQTVDLLAIPILNTASGGVPASQLQIVPPVIASTIPGASAVNSVVAQAKSNPLVFGAFAVIGLVLLFKVIE